MNPDLQNYFHKSYKTLTNEWVLVLPHRAEQL
jgi:galactose-1-phosphate uridylyltransferase